MRYLWKRMAQNLRYLSKATQACISPTRHHIDNSLLACCEVRSSRASTRLLGLSRRAASLHQSAGNCKTYQSRSSGKCSALCEQHGSRTFQPVTSFTEEPNARQAYSTKTRAWQRNVFIALGSNIGNSIAHIEEACRRIDADEDMRIIDTSCLYDTAPMYVEDQARFVNGACEIETRLDPFELLDRLQQIEKEMGRQKLIDKGPRNVDLDIIGYRQQIIKTERLSIPHALLHERAFVLGPLNDLRNGSDWIVPTTKQTARWHLQQLPDTMSTVTPLNDIASLYSNDSRTTIMSILNVTPDSFSDGGKHSSSESQQLRETILQHIRAGAKMIDIGGQSSRPDAVNISAQEETERVLPAVKIGRSLSESADLVISIDTYRAEVAKAALKAGADVVNDISAGTLDPNMLQTVAELGCTYVMMHMRGTPATMSSKENCSYDEGLQTIINELQLRVDAAVDAGVRRWRILLDPGIGFAKDMSGNLEILRNLSTMKARFERMAWLVGSSRKRFIGQLTGVERASDRVYGTAATVTAAIAGGADVIRVHDVEEMRQVAAVADAIYRS